MNHYLAALAIATLPLAQSALAANWSNANAQLLHGNGYQLGDDSRTILTIEYAAGWDYGDLFLFTDITQPNQRGTAQYTEFSPRLSLNKLSGHTSGNGLLKELFIATTQEMGDGLHAQLLGIGASLKIPGFKFTNLNFYLRKSQRDWLAEQSDVGKQLTLAWQRAFDLGRSHWVFEGFVDYAWDEDGGSAPKADNLMTAPRLMLDLSNLWGQPDTLWVGSEYQVWHNKFGVKNVDEEVAQVMLKWLF